MAEKLNTLLLCLILALLVYSLRRQPCEVGRFQQIDTPAHQVAFDTKTGQQCWSWRSVGEKETDYPGNFPLCVDLAKQ